jgi:hypothetical protein
MTLEDFTVAWSACTMDYQKRDFLASPATCGLLAYCRAIAQRQPLPATLPSPQRLLDVFRSPHDLHIANVFLECAQLAAEHHWPSGTVATAPLAALHAKYFPSKPAHLPVAFLRDLTEELLIPEERIGKPRPARATTAVLFPLVWQEKNREPDGKLAQFSLDLLDGPGQVFLCPQQAFLELKGSFSTIFRHAAEALAKHVGCCATGDVRVRIEDFHAGQLWNAPLEGNSAGGALALGLWSLWTQTPLQAGVVTSFALAPQPERPDAPPPEPDGKCHSVGGILVKAQEIAETLGANGVFLVADADKDEALKNRAKHMRLHVEEAQALRAALQAASGLLGELLAYLDALVVEANRVPPYYPRDARLDRVRVRVRVSSERQRYDQALAEERERNRLLGIADDAEAFLVYKHRHSRDGSAEDEREERNDQPRVEVLDWDTQVHGKVRLGVVVGDPGLGKTWLMKWEAANHARDAAAKLRNNGDLSRVIIPIYRRLTDVAAGLLALESRRAHGKDDLPSLPDAVVASLQTWQLPATDTGPSSRLSQPTLDFLRGRLGTEGALLLLDAFDEVPPDQRAALLRVLGEWVPANNKARVLFTSRVVGYQPPWTIPERSETEREMELLPFDDAQMGAFADAFFAGDSAAAGDLREMLRRTPQVRGVAQVPLLLGFLCALYREERQRNTRRDWELMRRTDLYEAVLQRLLSGQWKEPPRPPRDGEVEAKRELLGPVAFQLFLAGKQQFPLREVRQAFRSAHAALYPRGTLTADEVTRRIDEWREQDGVLVKAGDGPDAPHLFLHLTFQEYLTACYLAERINEHGGWDGATVPVEGKDFPAKLLVDRKAWLPSWQEVIVLLAGKLKDAVPLLEMLSDDESDDIFRHRLALAALCLPEIKELLEAP